MHPGIFILAAAAAAFYAFRSRAVSMTPEQRAAAMTRLPDLLFKIITKVGTLADRSQWAAEAVNLAVALTLPKTAEGIKTSKGMPGDEVWPGTTVSVAQYMSQYVAAQKPKALPAVTKKYNDEAPYPPFDDPRKARAKALSLEKTNPVEAKVWHTKADTLNTLIKAAKLKNAGKAAYSALTSIVKS